jgi:hypothetical protein
MTLSSVDSLLDAVGRLPPDELNDFAVRFADWRQEATDEQTLVRAIRRRLNSGDEARLRDLVRKSEQGQLTRQEQAEYRELARQAERVNVHRVQALAELVRRRGKPVREIMQEVGWEDGT